MWYLYLDESGDLGFDFVSKRPSKYFTVTILALSSVEANRDLSKAVRLVLRRKLNPRKHRSRMVQELKGSDTTIEIKSYFYKKIKNLKFGVYSVTLNKRKLFEQLARDKSRVYNYIARLVLDEIPFEKNIGSRVELILDRCMGKPEIEDFNSYIREQLKGKLSPNIPLGIYHRLSHENTGLQVADMFAWGIFHKYEYSDLEWYDQFKEKVLFDRLFL